MFLLISGAGAMGKAIVETAQKDGEFSKIALVEPLKRDWPEEKADLIIDFSHPAAIKDIYGYCQSKGGGIPVVIGTTGYGQDEERILAQLRKICPVDKRSNFSRGIEAMNRAVAALRHTLPADIGVEEIHHKMKKDSPSGTAKTLCDIAGVDYEDAGSLRLGTVFGRHTVYFAMEDELLEITHNAYSRGVFAAGAIEAGKVMVQEKRDGDRIKVSDR